MDPTTLAERATAYLWVALAACGILARSWRLWLLWRIHPKTEDERRYLASVIRSSCYRFGVKLVLLVGGLQAAFGFIPGGFWVWRAGICLALLLLFLEDMNVVVSRRGIAREIRGTS